MKRYSLAKTRTRDVLVAVLVSIALAAAAQAKCGEEVSVSKKANTQQKTVPQSSKRAIEHPDGNNLWRKWGISARTLTREERAERESTISSLQGREPWAKGVLLELAGEKKMGKGRPVLDILGVDSLPTQPKRSPTRLSDDALQSVDGFVISSNLRMRTPDLNPDRVTYTHMATKERVRVLITYADSPAEAFCRFVESSHLLFSAPLGLVLPTCRIKNGPGDFCWLGWNRSNEQHTLFWFIRLKRRLSHGCRGF